MHTLNEVVFSKGLFSSDEHNVRFLETIGNEIDGQYVVLVSKEAENGDYRAFFAQIHFVTERPGGFDAMSVPLVESFSDEIDYEDGATEEGEIAFLQDELGIGRIDMLHQYKQKHGIRAELNMPVGMDYEDWDDFYKWFYAEMRPNKQFG